MRANFEGQAAEAGMNHVLALLACPEELSGLKHTHAAGTSSSNIVIIINSVFVYLCTYLPAQVQYWWQARVVNYVRTVEWLCVRDWRGRSHVREAS